MTHSSEGSGVGVLLTNVGTPEAPDAPAVRTYLREFLSDPRVVDYPRWLWLPLLHAVILRVRPSRSARLYRSIWTNEGSPLKTIMERIAGQLSTALNADGERTVYVEIGMRYGRPSIAEGLNRLRDKSVQKIVVFPLYPQYSRTTTATTYDAIFDTLREWPQIPTLKFISDYHDHPAYLGALETHVRSFWENEGQPERLQLSFHGIPERYAHDGDPYPRQCERSAGLLAGRLGLGDDAWGFSYQSRFGPEPWLQPYTDQTLEQLGQRGVETLHVLAPGFSVDCLETLEELQVEGKGLYQKAGGGTFRYIPALNTDQVHIEALATILIEHLATFR